jgi:uncharacterized protein
LTCCLGQGMKTIQKRMAVRVARGMAISCCLVAILAGCGRSGQADRGVSAEKRPLSQQQISQMVDDVIERDRKGNLISAAMADDLESVKSLLSKGADPNIEEQGCTPLLCAIGGKNRVMAKALIDAKADVNHKTEDGVCPLAFAVANEDVEMVKLLLSKGADPNIEGVKGIKPLELAVRKGNATIVKILKSAGAKEVGQSLDDSLLAAVKKGDVESAKTLLASNANVDAADAKKRTSLMLAVLGENTELVKLLLEKGADLEAKDGDGESAASLALKLQNKELADIIDKAAIDRDPERTYFEAIKKNDLEAVKRALEHVDVNARIDGTGPIWICAEDPDLLAFLIDKGASVNFSVSDVIQRSPLMLIRMAHDSKTEALLVRKGAIFDTAELNNSLAKAVGNQDADLVAVLLKKKADPNHFMVRESLLMVAAERGYVEMVNLLLANGASPNLGIYYRREEDFGKTPLFFAVESGNAEVVKSLLQKGAKVNAQTKGGTTALMEAVKSKEAVALTKLLLEAGANPKAKSRKGVTALMIAANEGNDAVVKILEQAGAKPSPLAAQTPSL